MLTAVAGVMAMDGDQDGVAAPDGDTTLAITEETLGAPLSGA
jgi:hypothetical protein